MKKSLLQMLEEAANAHGETLVALPESENTEYWTGYKAVPITSDKTEADKPKRKVSKRVAFATGYEDERAIVAHDTNPRVGIALQSDSYRSGKRKRDKMKYRDRTNRNVKPGGLTVNGEAVESPKPKSGKPKKRKQVNAAAKRAMAASQERQRQSITKIVGYADLTE